MKLLHKGAMQNTLHITWGLLTVNNICDLLRNAWRTTEWLIHGLSPLNVWSIYLQNSNSKFYPIHIKKGTGDEVGGTVGEVGGSETENMLVTIKPGNQYWKHYPLLEKSFTKHLILKFLLKVLSILKSRFFLGVLQMIVV